MKLFLLTKVVGKTDSSDFHYYFIELLISDVFDEDVWVPIIKKPTYYRYSVLFNPLALDAKFVGSQKWLLFRCSALCPANLIQIQKIFFICKINWPGSDRQLAIR